MNMAEQQPAGVEDINKVLGSVFQPVAEEKKVAKPRRRSAPKQKVIMKRGKRKRAIARARLIKGNGRITINNIDVNMIKPKELRELVLEPINFSSLTRSIASSSDIKVRVFGGGYSGQLQAARNAIAKAIAEAAGSDVVQKAYLKYDRSMLVDDVRLVEPKKFLGPKARARFQKSYR